MPQEVISRVEQVRIPRNFLWHCAQQQVDKDQGKDGNGELELLDLQPGTEYDCHKQEGGEEEGEQQGALDQPPLCHRPVQGWAKQWALRLVNFVTYDASTQLAWGMIHMKKTS